MVRRRKMPACFIERNHDGQALAYANIAKLPELLRQPKLPRSHDVRFRG
jgi:hypothetical protein